MGSARTAEATATEEREQPLAESAAARADAKLERNDANRAGQALLGVGQAKLEVSAADDRYEQEADAVARQVVESIRSTAGGTSTPRPSTVARRIQRRGPIGAAGGELDADVENRLNDTRGGGQALDGGTRATMESAFGADFSDVRVHTGPEAAELNKDIQARAFTVGSDIYFRDGAPDMSSPASQELLAHELTHVVQQTGGPARSLQRLVDDGDPKVDAHGLVAEEEEQDEEEAEEESAPVEAKAEDEAEENESDEAKEKAGIVQRDWVSARPTALQQPQQQPQQQQGWTSARPTGAAVPDSTPPTPVATTSVTKLGTPGPNITALLDPDDYGAVDTEAVKVTLTARLVGSQWRGEVTHFEGEYSKVVRLPPGCTEVTGPGGNTTRRNSRAQIRSLRNLGGRWYMLQAVEDHESVHETRVAPALAAVEPALQRLFNALTVEHTRSVNSPEQAAAAIKALPAYAAAVARLRNIWDAEYSRRIRGDHNVLTPTAEHAVVDPMIDRINQWRVSIGRPAV